MSRFKPSEKVEMVRDFLNSNSSIKNIAKQHKVDATILGAWIRLYEQHGCDAFARTYTTYSTQFKMDVLNYMSETGTSSYEAAAIFNISSPGMIRNWQARWLQGGNDALQPKKKGRPVMNDASNKKNENKEDFPEGSVEALQAKIQRLEMENAYLKKLNALVQSTEKLQTKSKRK
jgi:transposase